jgi:hypothetical protein
MVREAGFEPARFNPLDPKGYKSLILQDSKGTPAKDFKELANLASW